MGILAEQLNKKDMNTQTDLISEIENAWEKLSQEIIDNWFDSIPGKLCSVLRMKVIELINNSP